MTLSLKTFLIADRLAKYHPYTVAYRAPGSERYRDFGKWNPRAPESFPQFARELDWPGDRQRLVSCLSASLGKLGAPGPVGDNIRKLAAGNTYAIVAGHQPALFGGPLFLTLKLITVIRLCEILNSQGDIHFVPVYWNGSEDHNPAEFGRVTILDRNHDQVHLTLPAPAPAPAPASAGRRMAARIPAAEASSLLAALEKQLPRTEFTAGLVGSLAECVCGSLGELQTRLILKWFGRWGLVVVEPHTLRSLAAPVIARALRDTDEVRRRLEADTKTMEGWGFAAPLPVPEAGRTLVYYHEDGRRYRLRRSADGYAPENLDRDFPGDAAEAELQEHPERFSPAAALRPVAQGAALPVAAYVAGGGELAYHLQLRGLYSFLGVKLPLLVPRAAGTVLKRSLLKTMERIGLDPAGLLSPGWEGEAVDAAATAGDRRQAEAFAEFRRRLEPRQDELAGNLRHAGVRNLNELEREFDRFRGRLEGVQKRFRHLSFAGGEGPRRQYYRLRKFVLPAEKYQELSLWTVYFLALFGPEFLPALLQQVEPLTDRHHIFIGG